MEEEAVCGQVAFRRNARCSSTASTTLLLSSPESTNKCRSESKFDLPECWRAIIYDSHCAIAIQYLVPKASTCGFPDPANVSKGAVQCVDGHVVAPVKRTVSGIDANGNRVWVRERGHVAPSGLTSGMHVQQRLVS